MKENFKKAASYLATIVVTLFAAFVFASFILRPKPLPISAVEINTIADGTYIGVCQNKILFAVVEVTIQNHEITGIEVIEHKASYLEQAKQIARTVCLEQSLEIDAISGATLTSSTVLKAIENALEDAERSSNRK